MDHVIDAFEAHGYEFRGDQGKAGGLLFVLEDRPAHRLAHVHAVRYGDSQWQRYLAVRDRLRADPATRDAYAELKCRLADQHPDDRETYTNGKASFFVELRVDW